MDMQKEKETYCYVSILRQLYKIVSFHWVFHLLNHQEAQVPSQDQVLMQECADFKKVDQNLGLHTAFTFKSSWRFCPDRILFLCISMISTIIT